MLTQQSTIHGKYHRNTSYLLGNADVGTQEFVGMGNHVDDGQMTDRQLTDYYLVDHCSSEGATVGI